MQWIFLRCSTKGHRNAVVAFTMCVYIVFGCGSLVQRQGPEEHKYSLWDARRRLYDDEDKRVCAVCGASKAHRPSVLALTLSTLRDLLHYLAPVAKRDFMCALSVKKKSACVFMCAHTQVCVTLSECLCVFGVCVQLIIGV